MNRFITPLLFSSLILCSPKCGTAGLIGDTVSLSREIPSANFVYGPLVFAAQSGPLDTVALSLGNNHYANVEDDRLEFIFGPNGGSGGGYPAMGHVVKFADLSPTAPTIGAISYQTNLNRFPPSYISFAAHSVTIAQGGLNWSGGETLTIYLQFVPEPSTATLSGIAACATLFTYRRKSVPQDCV